jgi:hypothetical protein
VEGPLKHFRRHRGRYVDQPAQGKEIVIELNYAFTPYCACNPRLELPLPTNGENRLHRLKAELLCATSHLVRGAGCRPKGSESGSAVDGWLSTNIKH